MPITVARKGTNPRFRNGFETYLGHLGADHFQAGSIRSTQTFVGDVSFSIEGLRTEEGEMILFQRR